MNAVHGEHSPSDLLFQHEIREAVRDAYRAIPAGAGPVIAERLYSSDELGEVPEDAIAWALGVGNPVRHAGLQPGQVVLDVGCGAGIDTVLAARRVGPSGRVIAVDMLPEMVERATAVVALAGSADWCDVRVGEQEAIPLPDASVDVVVSNGVLNLSPRKSRALAEAARVLKPGGRLCAADLTVDDDLPPEVLASEAAWAGCIAGAVSERVLAKKLGRVGFTDIVMGQRRRFSLDDVALYPLFTSDIIELMRRVLPAGAQQTVAVGLIVQAAKPLVAPPGRDHALLAAASGTTPLVDIAPDSVEADGVTVRHLKSVEDVELKVLDIAPGSSTPFHSHPHAHEGVIIGGAGVLRLDGRRHPLHQGDTFTVNPTDRHSIMSASDQSLRFVCMDCFVE